MSSRKSVGVALTAKVVTVGLILTLGAFVIHPPSTTHAAGVNQARGTTLREGFVVRYENGHSVCRIASADEATQMFQRVSRRAQKVGLHRLTDVNSAQATSSGIRHRLNIILRGTTQLESAPQAKAAFIRLRRTGKHVFRHPSPSLLTSTMAPQLLVTHSHQVFLVKPVHSKLKLGRLPLVAISLNCRKIESERRHFIQLFANQYGAD